VFLYCFVFIKTVNSVKNGDIQIHFAPALDKAYIQSLQTSYLLSKNNEMSFRKGGFITAGVQDTRHVEHKSKNEAVYP